MMFFITPYNLRAVRELEVPGNLYERKTYPFEFSTVEMPHESYNGINVRLRYDNYLTALITLNSQISGVFS